MPTDVYAAISDAPTSLQERLIDVLEMRVTDARQQGLWLAYLSTIQFPPNARVLEIGCGTGAVTRILARWPGVGQTIGVDPSAIFIAKAQSLAQDLPNLSFEVGEGRSLRFAAESFDVVVVHQVLSHVPQPERLITEAFRVLRPNGCLAVYDGDYATATVSIGEPDPLQQCVYAFQESFIHDIWIVRRLPQLLHEAGFEVLPMQSHGYVEAPEGAYMLTWIERGADALLQKGCISKETAEAFKAEAKRRSNGKLWFGHIAFASILCRKPT
jgi:arsenite methyltransferase